MDPETRLTNLIPDPLSVSLSARIPQVPARYGYYVDVEEYELGDLDEPPNYKAALADPKSDKWLEVMNTEMQSMKDNQVWYLVDLPSNGRTVGCKWIFKKKTDMDDIRAIRILLAITAFYDYEIWQMDVKTAFLNDHLTEDVYMVQSEGSWNKKFDVEFKKIGFTQNPDEPCVYLKASGSNVVFLILYVDDILLMGNNVTKKLNRGFDGKLQEGYTPMMEKPDYRKSQGAKIPSEVQRMQRVPYASAIGSIMYLVRCTRLDVAFAQNLCSHFQQNPGEIH
ncbi:retrotransposon protein, putative, ty1-copia subclass [Tanacetum coccineum]